LYVSNVLLPRPGISGPSGMSLTIAQSQDGTGTSRYSPTLRCFSGSLAVVGEDDVPRALVHGELELPVLGQLLAAAVVHPSRGRVLLVPERLLDLLAVDPVPQRPGVRAAFGIAARMLARQSRAAPVGAGTVVSLIALLEDSPATVDRQSYYLAAFPDLTMTGMHGHQHLTCINS
jgi:hypothetical protein